MLKALILDSIHRQRQDKSRMANTMRRFDSLNTKADMPLSYRGFFVSAFLYAAFFYGRQEAGGLRPLVLCASLSTRLLSFANVFDSTSEYLHKEKGKSL